MAVSPRNFFANVATLCGQLEEDASEENIRETPQWRKWMVEYLAEESSHVFYWIITQLSLVFLSVK